MFKYVIKFVHKITTGSNAIFFNVREADKRQAVNTRLSSPSEASVITKPHRIVKKKVTFLSFPTVNLVCLHVYFSSDTTIKAKFIQ